MPRAWQEDYVSKTLPKKQLDTDVLTMARERMRFLFEAFDVVIVSFSGGKDSTVVLNLALEEAEHVNRLPLDVIFWDEEAIHPETIAYVDRVRKDPRVRLRWLCLPVQHVNACSPKHPFWYPWAPEDEAKWCRPLPPYPQVERTLPGFARKTIPESSHLTIPKGRGTVVLLNGMRADESLRRHMSVSRREADNYITHTEYGHATAKPIYDWQNNDVWLAPQMLGWDYNRTYDLLEQHGVARADQRVSPPFGEQPMINLSWYPACFPDLWERMCRRVPGAATAARYAKGELYAYKKMELPPGRTWKEMVGLYLARHTPQHQKLIAERIKATVADHNLKTNNAPIPDEEKHELTGVSWRFLAKIACRGDLKKRKQMMRAGRNDTAARLKNAEIASVGTEEEPEVGE